MNSKHYERVWSVVRFLVGGTLRRLFAYEHTIERPAADNYLVVANHNTDLDPALVGLAFPRQMYFLASEHAFRMGFASRVLTYLFAPISRIKGATDAAAAMELIRRLRKGDNLCLFAEGNRSFSGVTGPIFPATGKLAKASGAALVTFKLEGGYLTSPRWSTTLRRGHMRGYCVNTYSPEQLRAMRPDEINAAIATDLFEDAYARQQVAPCDYKGKRLAEGLEDALFLCPVCGGVSTLKGCGDTFRCSACGMTATYTPSGLLTGEKLPFTTVRDWDAWQQTALSALLETAGDATLFSNADICLLAVGQKHSASVVASGTLTMSRLCLTVGTIVIPLAQISDMAIAGPTTLMFTANGVHYEMRAADKRRYCGRKYLLAYQQLKDARN